MATMFFVAFLHFGCDDFIHPVESTPTPTEYEYNYWLLKSTYLYESDLDSKPPHGEDVSDLYKGLSDRFTRYVPPSNSSSASISLNTSIVPGDIGLEYAHNPGTTHPLSIYRVYPESPASRAGVPRYASIFSINEVELNINSYGDIDNLYANYRDILSKSKEIRLKVLFNQDTLTFTMEKEDVYAPTVFVDTLYNTIVITISEFKQTTIDKIKGSRGELQAYLDSTRNEIKPRLINLVGNPGGHVNQCVAMADMFIASGKISTRTWRSFGPDGKTKKNEYTEMAHSGDAGENHPFALLVNRNSASCAEIFAVALAEGANIPVIGDTSYGKGIGQTTWNTIDKGIAIITNLEFLTPKGNSYHQKGIVPDHLCEKPVTVKCGTDWIKDNMGKETSQSAQASKSIDFIPLKLSKTIWAEASIDGN